MKATKVKYEKTFNLGNYSNEVIGVEIELADGETAKAAIEKAREYVNNIQVSKDQLDKARRIVEAPDGFYYSEVNKAREILAAADDDDLPF